MLRMIVPPGRLCGDSGEAFLGFARPNHSVILITFSIPINYFSIMYIQQLIFFFLFLGGFLRECCYLWLNLYCIAQVYYIPTANILILILSF